MLMWRGVRVKEVIKPGEIMNEPRKVQVKGQLLKLYEQNGLILAWRSVFNVERKGRPRRL